MNNCWPFLILISLLNYVSPNGVGTQGESHVPFSSQNYNYNVTIMHLSPRSVEVSWNCRGQSSHDKYEVTLKPLEASYKVVDSVPYNTCSLLLQRLEPNTNYQVSVSSISGRVRRRSSSVIFRTYMEMDYPEIIDEEDEMSTPPAPTSSSHGNKDRLHIPRVRLVEISLVGMALVLWAGAIVLFFHRWGKIRMLLPYQPDYKEMKRSASVCVNCSMTPHHQCCRVHQLQLATGGGGVVVPVKAELISVPLTDTGCSPIRSPIRPRLNSFIVYDINEFRKEHEKVCRKSKSAENLGQHSSFQEESAEDLVADFACTEL